VKGGAGPTARRQRSEKKGVLKLTARLLVKRFNYMRPNPNFTPTPARKKIDILLIYFTKLWFLNTCMSSPKQNMA
jgi:hypothetical protein